MEKLIVCFGLSGISSGVITPVANYGFSQHWNPLIVWVVMFFVFYFGEYVLD